MSLDFGINFYFEIVSKLTNCFNYPVVKVLAGFAVSHLVSTQAQHYTHILFLNLLKNCSLPWIAPSGLMWKQEPSKAGDKH